MEHKLKSRSLGLRVENFRSSAISVFGVGFKVADLAFKFRAVGVSGVSVRFRASGLQGFKRLLELLEDMLFASASRLCDGGCKFSFSASWRALGI